VRNIAEQLAGKAAVVQINTQENQALASRFGVRGIPVVMLVKQGKAVDKLVGAQTAEAVLAWFRRHG
jgi:thioredoxin 2